MIIPDKINRAMGMPDVTVGRDCPTILSTILGLQLPESEVTTKRPPIEVLTLLVGGIESSSVVLERLTYFVLSNASIRKQLYDEISAAATDTTTVPNWQALEQLPFLGAVILKSLRLMYSISGRSPRVATDEDLVYTCKDVTSEKAPFTPANSFIIPHGSEISMSCYLIHSYKSIFPNAEELFLGRWLDDEGKVDRSLELYLFTFLKGSRIRIGTQHETISSHRLWFIKPRDINDLLFRLAYCELYICTATLVLRVFPRLKLYNSGRGDTSYDHDEFLAIPVSGSKGIRAVVTDYVMLTWEA